MFSVDLVVREWADHLIVGLRGELDLADAEEVTATLAAVAAGRRKTIVDLADLAFIDCRGAAALARAQRRVRQAGGDLLLAAPRPLVQRVFVLSRLIDVVRVHASVEQAIGAGEIPGLAAVPPPEECARLPRPARHRARRPAG
jgi:anti-sigma B factor antagonist